MLLLLLFFFFIFFWGARQHEAWRLKIVNYYYYYYYYNYYYYCNNNKNTLKIERKSKASGKKKMFSVFCHCSILRTLSLVVNIIIIITIITTIVLVYSPCLWCKTQWKTACCLSELPLRFAERYSLSLLFPRWQWWYVS